MSTQGGQRAEGPADLDVTAGMLAYYDERAPEYEDIYKGSGPASISDPEAYCRETQALAGRVRAALAGDVIDIGCGTGFWMPHYAARCSRITLFDQSPRMLDQCRYKAEALGIVGKCAFVQGDFFAHTFEVGTFDMALIGFLLSHVPHQQEAEFFARLRRMLRPGGTFLIVDSAWSPQRAQNRAKAGRQMRKLNDGRTFEIYKRYFDADELAAVGSRNGIDFADVQIGGVFLAAIGRFR